MRIIESLKNELKKINGISQVFNLDLADAYPHRVHRGYGKRTHLYFFDRNDSAWEVETPLTLLDDCYSEEKDEVDCNVFLRNCIQSLITKRGITVGDEVRAVSDQEYKYLSNDLGRCIDATVETVKRAYKPILVINDVSKSGKTIIIKQCWNYWKSNSYGNLWWIDFNDGRNDFSNIISEVIQSDFSKDNYVILDNLECCGYVTATKILQFFIDLVVKIRQRDKNIYLIVVQNSEQKVFFSHDQFGVSEQDVDVINESISRPLAKKKIEELKKEESEKYDPEIEKILLEMDEERVQRSYDDRIAKIINFLLSVMDEQYAQCFYADELKKIKKFLSAATDKEAVKLLYQIILFAKYDVKLVVNNTQKETLEQLLDAIGGIKLYYNGIILYHTKAICSKLYDDLSNDFAAILGDDFFDENNGDILKYYYSVFSNSNIKSVDIAHLLLCLPQTNHNQKNIDKFCDILNAAQSYCDRISAKILDWEEGEKLYDNHFGEILFAAEALSVYAENDWSCLRAWVKLHEHIRKMYFLEGQKRLPELSKSHKNTNGIKRPRDEGTVQDFVHVKEDDTEVKFAERGEKPKYNCLKNQILVHNLLLEQCKNFGVVSDDDIKTMMQNKDWIARDDALRFVLSDMQRAEELEVDVQRFFGTYLLALLFEFEVTAPIGQQDNDRIEQLWEHIKHNIINKDDYAYFYPARVPWVTARMLLALCATANNPVFDGRTRTEINGYRQKLATYLKKCCITFFQDNKRYGVWTAGTGLWNSVFETTIMCVSAIKEADPMSESGADCGVEYIRARTEHAQFESGEIADELWAYLILNKTDIGQRNLIVKNTYEIGRRFIDKLNKFSDAEAKEKETPKHSALRNDKSLGFTHVAKTYIDLINALILAKPKLSDFDVEYKENASSNEEIVAVFQQPTRESLIKQVVKVAMEQLAEKLSSMLQDKSYNGVRVCDNLPERGVIVLDSAEDELRKVCADSFWAEMVARSKDWVIDSSKCGTVKNCILETYREIMNGKIRG